MIICESQFTAPDKDNPEYSQCEIDCYAWTPDSKTSHRLSLRKNLRTGLYEVYRRFNRPQVSVSPVLTAIMYDDSGLEELAFAGSLADAVAFADAEYRKHHGDKTPDTICQHRYPNRALGCCYPYKE